MPLNGALPDPAAQFARVLGAGRVIGNTGSRGKAARLVSKLSYDAALVQGERPIAEQLAEAAPEGHRRLHLAAPPPFPRSPSA